jgi:hypothetical protein
VQFPDPEPAGLPPLDAHQTSEAELVSDAALNEAGLASEIGLELLNIFDGLLQQLEAAAELCLKPLRYGARYIDQPVAGSFDCCVQLEARDPAGERQGAADLELEIYRSGSSLNLMLSRPHQPQAPLLWHGQHPVWMDADSGERCERPPDGAPLEALARRVRALL